jgi:threonine/homoserine/homoserine lactone efflux protein
MTWSGILLFAGIYLMAVATPGPGMAAVIARVMANGTKGIAPFLAGYIVGDLVWFTVAATGLALVAQTYATVFVVIKYAGAAYLLYLAWKIFNTPVRTADVAAVVSRESALQTFLGSLALTLGNPKVIVFFLSIMPLAVEMADMRPMVFAELALVIIFTMTPVLLVYTLLAERARRLFRSERALKAINRGTAGAMAGVAVAIAVR